MSTVLRPVVAGLVRPPLFGGGVRQRAVPQAGVAVLPAENVIDYDIEIERSNDVFYSASPTPTFVLTAGGLWQIAGRVTLEGTGVAESPRLRVYDAVTGLTLYVQEFITGVMGGQRFPFTFAVQRRLDFGAQICVAFTSDVAPCDIVIVDGDMDCEIELVRLGQ